MRTTQNMTGRWEQRSTLSSHRGTAPRGRVHSKSNIMGALGNRPLLAGRHQPLVPLDAACERYLYNFLGEDQDALPLGRGKGKNTTAGFYF